VRSRKANLAAGIAIVMTAWFLALGVWMPMSYVFTIIAEPFPDLRVFVIESLELTFALSVFSLPITLFIVATIRILIGLTMSGGSLAEHQRIRSATRMIRTARWLAIPVLLVGVHLSCWVMQWSISQPSVDWTRQAPTMGDFAWAWLVPHGAGLLLAVMAWLTLAILQRWLRRMAFESGTCERCGYALAGLTTPICPECGERLPTLQAGPGLSE